jgi:O-antigen chain-terminating methyltransferase
MAPYADLFRGSRKVLDIGCGPGLFLELLRERNIPAHGIDYDPIMVDMCRDKGLSASISDARSLISEEPEFDGVHLGHVVEHMDGPTMVNLLEECAQLLRPGGQILIRTPNWNNETVRGGGFWLDHTHVRPYPLELLDRILSDMGLVVTNKGYEEGGWQDTVIVARRPDAPPFAEALDAIASELRPNTVGQRR